MTIREMESAELEVSEENVEQIVELHEDELDQISGANSIMQCSSDGGL